MTWPAQLPGALTRAETPWPLSRSAALFLDLDGTLAPFRPAPGDVGPDPRRNGLLGHLQAALAGGLAVISGRTVEELDRILDRRIVALAGVHGLQRRTAWGASINVAPDPSLEEVRRRFVAFAADKPKVLVEIKYGSVALHFRQAPESAEAAYAVAAAARSLSGLIEQRGEAVVELRTAGPSKGDAVAAFMAEPPFAGRQPVFVGDDLTDEAAFAAVAEAGGIGVLVGPQRPTLATHGLTDPEAVLTWLVHEASQLEMLR